MPRAAVREAPNVKQNLYGLLLLPANRPGYLLAQRLHIWPERLSEYANGRRIIPDRVLMRMCRILRNRDGCLATPSDILGTYDVNSYIDVILCVPVDVDRIREAQMWDDILHGRVTTNV